MFAIRDGVRLSYEVAGEGRPMVLTHCWAGDHTYMTPVFDHFRRDHRVVSVDARGHGSSDKPASWTYSMSNLASDIIWLCDELGVKDATFVGHSMGGNLTLEAAAHRPDLVRAAVIMDASTVPAAGLLEGFRPVLEGVRSPAYRDVIRGFMAQLLGQFGDPERRARMLDKCADNEQHVMVSALESVLVHDTEALAARCKMPMLYIGSGPWYTDVDRFRRLCPQLVTGQAVGSGHNLQLEVPDQVNAMIRRFVEINAG
jgi:pimeloyl-ACP methyl ester carboxylesterase